MKFEQLAENLLSENRNIKVVAAGNGNLHILRKGQPFVQMTADDAIDLARKLVEVASSISHQTPGNISW